MKVVTREAWAAREPNKVNVLPPRDVRFLVVHYSASDADEQTDHRNCAGRVRGIQAFHMDTNGWADIAYNWLVCKHGYVFRGRGIGVRSAATSAANGYTYAVCFLGDDTANRDDVTDDGREAIREVWRFVKRQCVNVEGARGHRDFMPTKCPGAELYHFARQLT